MIEVTVYEHQPTTSSISYSFTMRLAYPNHVGMLARIVSAIGKGGGGIGPEAKPVMEGKATLFKEFAGIDAYPICLKTKDTEIIATVKNLSVGFGGINLEDISAPRCFDVERELRAQLNLPVFHEDRHGTAVVVLGALLNALRLTRQKLERLRIVISGAGSAGMAVARILLRGGGAGHCGLRP